MTETDSKVKRKATTGETGSALPTPESAPIPGDPPVAFPSQGWLRSCLVSPAKAGCIPTQR